MKNSKLKTLKMYDPQMYPINLYVVDREEVKHLPSRFEFYTSVRVMQTRVPDRTELEFPKFAEACVCLVEDLDCKEWGVLVVIDKASVEASTIAHEAVHAADAVFDALCMFAQEYDDGNEPYAYLVGWIVSKIWEYKNSKI